MEPKYPLPPIRILSIERDAPLQHYKAVIDRHAEVKWQGIWHVLEKGNRMWAIPQIKMEALRQTLEKFDFLNIDRPKEDFPILPPHVDPSPGTFTITAVFMDGSSKTIQHDFVSGERQSKLHRLEARLETILGTRKRAGPPYNGMIE